MSGLKLAKRNNIRTALNYERPKGGEKNVPGFWIYWNWLYWKVFIIL